MGRSSDQAADDDPLAPSVRFLALTTSGLGCLLILGLGINRYSMDGSFWIDEASVAESLITMEPSELFGRLRYRISFPRIYLLVFKALNDWAGFETWILRLPSLSFFVLGTLLWVRLFYVRFRAVPLLIGLAILLNLFPTTWFFYSSMLKQYTFDVFLALLIFSLPDDSLDDIFRRGHRPALAMLLALPCALSYTYVFALFGRGAGWALAGGVRGRLRFARQPVFALAAGLLLFNASIYLTDVRHTLEVQSLSGYWRTCLIGAEGVQTLPLLDETFFGWYSGRTAYNPSRGMHPMLLHLFRLFFMVGCIRVVVLLVTSFRQRDNADPFATSWGSRSLGCLCMIAGMLIGAIILDYPLCSTRLILFALFAMQMMMLEGVFAIVRGLRHLPRGNVASIVALCALLLATLPDASREYRSHLASRPPDDLRPYLARIGPSNKLPIMVDACSSRQVMTLPEGIGEAELIRYLRRGRKDVLERIPYGEQAWVLNVRSFCAPFGNPATILRKYARSFETVMGMPGEVRLYRATFRRRP